ncbi:hypothetical protein [Kangiella aquimarina]|uniref:Uncharacterized protein n=1 Tax=Kangiella aquimarina TaxID=261965 RepID=A0ABZ0X6S1_9GAMM|nr:hypothetical protein [Kangiella aquimarina]WQG86302.1 hypothetical protein SR900_05290 [Kangiella aquimarina]
MNIFVIIRAIDEGLSKRQGLVIAILAVILSVYLVISAPESKQPKLLYILTGFCILVFVACLVEGRAKKFLGSVMALIFLALATFIMVNVFFSLIFFYETKPYTVPKIEAIISIAISLAIAIPSIKYIFAAQFGLKGIDNQQDENTKKT